MGIYNKIIINDEVMIDLSNDTVIEDKLIEGVTAHNAEGLQITGNLKKYNGEYEGDVEVLKATMYSYNGTVLPELPEWDKTAYPCTMISLYDHPRSGIKGYILDISASEYIGADEGFTVITPCMVYHLEDSDGNQTTSADGEWVLKYDLSGETIPFFSGTYRSLFWANYDVSDSDGTVYLSASNPIPVYE